MKEQIYTIPVNEAYEQECECPFCFLHKRLEAESVDYALGAAMMEPDYRILSNEKGYCQKHYSMMFEKPNKLSLALVLDTHLEEVRKKLEALSTDISALKNEKSGLFKKSQSGALEKVSSELKKSEHSCVICDKLDYTLERYKEVFFHLWQKDESFKDKFNNSKGFCIPHFNELLNAAFKYMPTAQASEFSRLAYEKELSELERIQSDIHKFTLKFDYRNKDMDWGTAADAPLRTIEKIAGHILAENEQQQ